MITLRNLVFQDRAIASITAEECKLIAKALDYVGTRGFFGTMFLPEDLRGRSLTLKMLSATLGRTPEEREPSLQTQIKIAMVNDAKRPD